MPKKRKSATKKVRSPRKKKAAKKTAAKKAKRVRKPKLAETVAKRILGGTEITEMKGLSAAAISAGTPVGACWFQDSGGSDQCIPLPQEVCKNRGGVWTPGPCPNR
jgi:hypothetical protein